MSRWRRSSAFALLLTLYASQRRDVQRLSAWMEREPAHPAADLRASETLLDRAEVELEAVLGRQEAARRDRRPRAGLGADPRGASTGAAHSDRPVAPGGTAGLASDQRAPGPGAHHHRARGAAPAPALAPAASPGRPAAGVGRGRPARRGAGLAAIFGSERLLQGDEQTEHHAKPGAIDPGDVEVAVLNGTSMPGLAGKVGDDVQVNGFKLGTISNSRTRFDQTVVMYEPGQRRAAETVAHDLGVKPVQRIDRQTEQVAGGADVVVIAGADRARP